MTKSHDKTQKFNAGERIGFVMFWYLVSLPFINTLPEGSIHEENLENFKVRVRSKGGEQRLGLGFS